MTPAAAPGFERRETICSTLSVDLEGFPWFVQLWFLHALVRSGRIRWVFLSCCCFSLCTSRFHTAMFCPRFRATLHPRMAWLRPRCLFDSSLALQARKCRLSYYLVCVYSHNWYTVIIGGLFGLCMCFYCCKARHALTIACSQHASLLKRLLCGHGHLFLPCLLMHLHT